MKRLEASAKQTVCSNPDSIFRYFGWPSVTRLPDGTLAAACSGFRLKHICPFGKAVICYSRDEGKSWTYPAVALDTPLDDRDAGIVPFGEGRVILTSFNNTIAAQRGWNGIESGEHKWTNDAMKNLSEAYLRVAEEKNAESVYLGSTYRISEDGGYTFGPIKRIPITAPHGPCRLLDGSLLYVGRVFSEDDSALNGQDGYIKCMRLDENDEWVCVSSIENVCEDGTLLLSCEPHAIQLPSGKIIVHIRVQGATPLEHYFTIYQCESTDGGRTFSKPRRLLAARGGAPAHLYLHSGGTLISVYGYRSAPYGIRAMFSRDEGQTWDTDWVLDDTGISGDLGYPATTELKDGRLLTVYYENTGDSMSVIQSRIWKLPV